MKISKRIGKGAEDFSRISEDFSRIWQVKSSKMIEILPKIFKKTFYFYFRENLEKSTQSLLGPAQASSGRLGPTRPSSAEPTTAELAELGLSQNSRALKNRLKNYKFDFPSK